MHKSTVYMLAAAVSGLVATSAGAADVEYTVTPGFEHTLKLTSPATNLTGSSPTSNYLNDSAGKGAGYAADVQSDGSQVFFFSSAIAAGRGNFAESVTEAVLKFTKAPVDGVKGLNSTIFESTFGLYVAPFAPATGACSGETLPSCPGVDSGVPDFRLLSDGGVSGNPFEDGQAGSYFTFEVLVNDTVQRSIGGKIVMKDNGILGGTANPGLGLAPPVILASSFIDDGNGNIVEGDINLLAGVLPGFQLLENDDYNYFFGWDQSDFSVAFDTPVGEGDTITYRVTAGAWGDSRRLTGVNSDPLVQERSILAFSCFADPVGRGSTRGDLIPIPVCDDFGGFGTGGGGESRNFLVFGQLDENGFFNAKGGVVPEPDTWAMLIAGFGLVGLSMRRSRKPAAATVTA